MPFSISNSIYKTDSIAISCNKQFCISSDNDAVSVNHILFQAPAYTTVTRELKLIGAFIHFTIRNSDLETLIQSKHELHHIAEYIQTLSSRNFSYDGCRIYIYVLGNSALFIVKRITDYLYTQVFNFEYADDLLYHLQSCFHFLNLDRSVDQLIICGEIDKDSKLVRLLSVYFSNLSVDTSLPISSLTL